MRYPADYTVLAQDELVYLEGGTFWTGAAKLFDKLIGVTFQKQFLSSIRNTTWDCLDQKSLKPVLEWGKAFWEMSLPSKVVFLYGGYLTARTTVEYWNKA